MISSSAAVTVSENQTAVLTVSATDPEGTSPIYAIVGGADQALFQIDGATGVLSFLATPDFEAPADANADGVYQVQVRASDGSAFTTQTVSVTVGNVNEAPVISSSAAVSVAENQTAVLTVSATDPEGVSPTYSILAGGDAALFQIDGSTGVLTFIGAPDRETPQDGDGDNVYNVQVRAGDGTNTTDQWIAVTVTDVNEAPSLSVTNLGPVDENDTGAVVASFTGSDPDSGDSVNYSLSGADAALFEIDGSNVRLASGVSLDFEESASRTFNVVATDSHGLVTQQSITLTVDDVVGETLSGTAGADTLRGNAGGDNLDGLAGNDTIYAGIGDDTLTGGTGDDVLYAGSGADQLFGGADDDLFIVDVDDTVAGGSGIDTVRFTDGGSIVLTGLSEVEEIDFTAASSPVSTTIDQATMGLLDPEGDVLTVTHRAGDTITVSGGTDNGMIGSYHSYSFDVSGTTYELRLEEAA